MTSGLAEQWGGFLGRPRRVRSVSGPVGPSLFRIAKKFQSRVPTAPLVLTLKVLIVWGTLQSKARIYLPFPS